MTPDTRAPRWMVAGFATVLALLAFSGASFLYSIRSIREFHQAETRSQRVLRLLEGVSRSVVDIETANRGFAITGDPHYLEPYEQVMPDLDRLLDEVTAALGEGNAEAAASLRQAVQDKVEIARRIIMTRREEGYDAARQLLMSGQPKAMMDRVRAVIDAAADAELEILKQRSLRAQEGTRRLRTTVAVIIGVSCVLIAYIIYLTLRHVRLQRRAADLIHEREQRLRSILDTAPECVKVIAPDGTIRDMNKAGLAMLDAEQIEDVAGMKATHLVAPEHRAAFEELGREALRGNPGWLTFDTIGIKGTRRSMESHVVPLRDASGDIEGVLAVTRDVTARREAESRLKEAERKYRTLVEQLPGILYVAEIGRNGRWRFVSPQIKTLLGYSEEEWLGQPDLWYRQIAEEDRDQVLAAEIRAFERGEPFVAEYRMRTRDGVAVWFRDEAIFVRGDDQGPVQMQGLMLDITARKEAEQTLREKDVLFLQSQKMEALGRLAGGVAHDFNNLLTSILGFGEILRDSLGPSHEMQSSVREIIEAANRASQLTRQLLAFSRKQPFIIRPIDLNHVVRGMDSLLRRTLGVDIELLTSLDQDLGLVNADEGLMSQVIMNLAVNARDAMPEGGTLQMTTSGVHVGEGGQVGGSLPPGDYALLSVRDTGAGMTDGVKRHVFEPFFTTKGVGKGTGLGLATVYGIVQQCNGYIHLYSEVDQGTEFRIYLPCASRGEAKAEPEDVGHLPRGAELVLVVEDEDAVRRLVVRTLNDLGYRVLEARNGAEALKAYGDRFHSIDLVLTDVIMPHVNGPTLARKLRESNFPGAILFMSGFTDGGDALDANAMFLTKPFTREALAQSVRRVLDR